MKLWTWKPSIILCCLLITTWLCWIHFVTDEDSLFYFLGTPLLGVVSFAVLVCIPVAWLASVRPYFFNPFLEKWTWRVALALAYILIGYPLVLYPWAYFASYGTVDIYISGIMLGAPVLAAALLGLLVVWIASLMLSRHRGEITLLFIVTLIVVATGPFYMPFPTELVARGFRDRCSRDESLKMLRELAVEAHPLIKAAHVNPESRVGLWKRDNSVQALGNRFAILRWMGGVESINEQNNVVSIWWGEFDSHVTGRWGILIGVNGQMVQDEEASWTLYPLAPDVAIVLDRS
jgi:hypothetical protein